MKSSNPSGRELSRAADAVLAELIGDLRARIVLEASERSGVRWSSDGDHDPLTAADIVEAYRAVVPHRMSRSTRRLYLYLLTYGGTGVVVAFVGSLLGLLNYGSDTLTLLVTAVGVALTATSGLMAAYLWLRRSSGSLAGGSRTGESVTSYELAGRFLDLWLEAEAQARTLAVRELGASANEAGIRTVLERLAKSGIVKAGIPSDIGLALDVRNRLMHGRPVTSAKVEVAGQVVRQLLINLHSWID